MKYYKQFLALKEYPPIERQTAEELCTLDMFQEFAWFISNEAKDDQGDFIMEGTATQYFSGVKNSFLHMPKFKDAPILQVCLFLLFC
jgi:hypothetical protein